MSVRLGINPLTWTNDDLPSLGGDTPLETCLTEGRQAGFSGFELGQKFPRTPQALSEVLARHDLALVSGWYSARLLERSPEEEIEALESHLDLLKACGADVMVFCEVSRCVHGDQSHPLSQRPHLDEADWARLTDGLNVVADHLEARGIRMAYHHHLGTVIESQADVERLMTSTRDSVGLLLDLGHLVGAGGDPLTIAQRHASRIRHVHCKDIRFPVLDDLHNRDKSFLDGVLDGLFTVPGDGNVEFLPTLEHLRASGYQGWLVVEAEQDPEVAHPLTYARLGYRNLRRLAERAGFSVDDRTGPGSAAPR
ncbi:MULTISPECIES: myo-inosose-2 dehydratase [unclassified Modicisalibacter]|uniref:myo-inosose-2 dehydratase n=1 Tax=unclassified Modicisalibacter TaxID=2679913 RepID=UPI001CD03668|nr:MULTISPECIES: myo-inosose-2 dehydratase [unclassified Modicisalibacter]MBZ9559391.1 myo-inosose-2 dehydratase [Modicisalibacter sp. R2A 31.J]MBZ9576444.1 myo-inosose-2 dehydratase [Modicisalibacter sp. MOD 31.J]